MGKAIFILPLLFIVGAYLAVLALTFMSYPPVKIFGIMVSPEVRHAIALSLTTATVSSLIAMALGVPTAYFLARRQFPGKALVDTLLDIPVFVSPIAIGALLLVAFSSPQGRWLQSHTLELVFEAPGIIVAQAAIVTALAVRLMKAGMHAVGGVPQGRPAAFEERPDRHGDSRVGPRDRRVWRDGDACGRDRAQDGHYSDRDLSRFCQRRRRARPYARGYPGFHIDAQPHRPAADRGKAAPVVIALDRIGLALGEFSLDDISLSVEDGEFFILLGPSGVGKTALLEAVAGLNPIRNGRVILDGRDVTDLPPEARPIAYVPQDASLFPHLSVRDNILFGVHARRLPEDAWRPLFGDLVETLQIETLLDRGPVDLSGGERRRVSLARALLTSPKILLLDEPFSGLDPPIRRELQILVKRLQQKLKGTFLQVTHDREEAFILGDIIAVMIDGRIEQVAKRNRLYFHPQSLKVARFTGMENIIEGEIVGVDTGSSRFTLEWAGNMLVVESSLFRPRVGRRIMLGVRAEEVMLVKPDRPIREGRDFNILSGNLIEILEKGATHTLVVAEQNSGQAIWMELPNFLYRRYEFREGQSISVRIRPDKFCIIESR